MSTINPLIHYLPAWTVIIPLLMIFFLAADGMLDSLMKSSKPYLAPVIFMGLFFVMAAAGWAGFLSTTS